MKQETRYNTIFIVALLAISLPGIIMLVRKKMNQPPRETRGALAAPVRTEVVYVDPLPHGPRLKAVVPPLTRQWVASQSPLVASLDDDVVLASARRSFELIGIDRRDNHLAVTVLLWDPRLPQVPDRIGFSITGAAAAREGTIRTFAPVALPEPVQSELRNRGYLTPPPQVWRLQVDFVGHSTEGTLRLRAAATTEPIEDQLDLTVAARHAGS